MISEHQFAVNYSSVWRTITPLADGFWSIENMKTQRVHSPLQSLAPKSLRAIVNEAAFRAFCSQYDTPSPVRRHEVRTAVAQELPASVQYIKRFSSSLANELEEIDDLSINDACILVIRLRKFFGGVEPALLRPKFGGCGLISECEGDVIKGSCLYEIKAGDRAFRVVDLRQLLIYAALAYASDSLNFTEVGLFNPRTGVAWKRSLEEVSRSLSGLRLSDTLSSLVEQFSAASVSR